MARCVEAAPEGIITAQIQINMPGRITRVLRRVFGKSDTGYVFMELVKRPNPVAGQNK